MSDQKSSLSASRRPCDLPSPESTNSFWHSQPSALLKGHRSTRELPGIADVVIIGSGMTGASVAHHLLANDGRQKDGASVVMLEAREACWGATGRNGGHCHPVLFEAPQDPTVGHFELDNFHDLQFLIQTKNIDCEFVVQPGVRAIYSRHHFDEVEFALLTLKDSAPELASMLRLVTNKDELTALRVPTALGAVVTDKAARMWPYKFVARILEDLITSVDLCGSFNLQTLTPVTKVSRLEGSALTVVETARGAIKAKKVVLATNAYTSHLLHSFSDLIVPCRGQMSALCPTKSVREENRLKTSLVFHGDGQDDYLIQRPNADAGHLMFGGGRQCGPSMGLTDDSVIDEKTAHYLRFQLIEALDLPEFEEIYPPIVRGAKPIRAITPRSSGRIMIRRQYELVASQEWTGIMGFSRDERPWVGAVPDTENVYIAAGYTGHGMPNTWLCGKTVALVVEKTLAGMDEDSAAEAASVETRLPKSYRTSRERMEAASERESVEAKDWAEMARLKKDDRPPSGYA